VPADTTEIETQHRKPTLHEHVIHVVHDTVIHRTAVQRVRMQHHGKRRITLTGVMIATFQPPVGAVEDDFRHLLTPSARRRADLHLTIDGSDLIWERRPLGAICIDGRIRLPIDKNLMHDDLTEVDIIATSRAGCAVFSVNAAFIAIKICGTGS